MGVNVVHRPVKLLSGIGRLYISERVGVAHAGLYMICCFSLRNGFSRYGTYLPSLSSHHIGHILSYIGTQMAHIWCMSCIDWQIKPCESRTQELT